MSKNSVSYHVSSDDLQRAVPGSVWLRYPDIKRFGNVDALLSSSAISVIFVLYLVDSSDSGHWTTLLRDTSGKICFCDPYGLCVDSELAFISAKKRRELDETAPLLLSLLVAGSQEEQWEFNSFDLQSKNPKDQTCGRYAILRALRRDLDSNGFVQWMKEEAKKDNNFDLCSVRLTEPYLN